MGQVKPFWEFLSQDNTLISQDCLRKKEFTGAGVHELVILGELWAVTQIEGWTTAVPGNGDK